MTRKLRNREAITLKESDTELLQKICKVCGNGFEPNDCVVVRRGLARGKFWIQLRHLDCITDLSCAVDDVFLEVPERY